MKKIFCLIIAVLVLLTSIVPIALATSESEFENTNVIVNGDFEGPTAISGKYPSILPACTDVSSPWIPYNADFQGVHIGEEVGNEENHVLIFENIKKNWWGVCQVLPINRLSTGIYNLKFRAKNAGTGKRGNITVRFSYVIYDGSAYNCKQLVSYRTPTYGGENEIPNVFKLDDHVWHEYDFDIDLMAKNNTGTYLDYTKDVVGMQIEILQDFDGKSNFDLAKQAGSDIEDTTIYIDDVELVMPTPLFAKSIDLEDTQNVNFENAEIPILFNYTNDYINSIYNGIKENSLSEITITDEFGTNVGCYASVYQNQNNNKNVVNIYPDTLKPDTNYTITIDKIASGTPVYNPNKNKSSYKTEKRYISMIGPQSFTFRTKSKIELVKKEYTPSTQKAYIRYDNNSFSDEASFILTAFEEKNGKITSSVYYAPVNIPAADLAEIEFENTDFASSAFTVLPIQKFGGNIAEDRDVKVTMNFSGANETLSVSGTAGSSNDNKEVITFMLLPKNDASVADMSVIDISMAGVSRGLFLAINKSITDSDGNFEISPVSIKGTGYYRVVSMIDDKVIADETGYYSSKADNEVFLRKINALSGSNAKNGLYDIISTEQTEHKIGFDYTYYDAFSARQKLLVCDRMISGIPYSGIDDFKSEFADAQLIVSIITSDSTEDMVGVLTKGKYKNAAVSDVERVLDLEKLRKTSVYKYFESADIGDQNDIIKEYINNVSRRNDANTADNFADALYISAINKRLDDTVLHTGVSVIINEFSDILSGLDQKAYKNAGTEQSDINTDIKDNRKTCISDFVDYVNKLVKNASGNNKKVKNNGGGSGSSGSKKVASLTSTGDTQIITPIVQPKKYFDDIPSGHWAEGAINALYDRKIVSGRGNGVFDLNGFVTREEFVKMIVGALELEQSDDDETFSDVDPKSWYAPYIATAHKNKIINGIGNGKFGIGSNITRQDMFVMCDHMIADFEVLTSSKDSSSYVDCDDISEYARPSVDRITKFGIISGDDKGRVNPNSNATRAEAAKVIYDILRIIKKL